MLDWMVDLVVNWMVDLMVGLDGGMMNMMCT